MRVTPFFRWYDLWIGFYWDRKAQALYFCPVPMFGIKIARAALATTEEEVSG